MIKFELNGKDLKVVIKENELHQRVLNLIKQIRGVDEVIEKQMSIVENTLLYHTILKDILLTEFIKQLGNTVKEGTPYMFKITLNNENLFYLVTSISDDKLPTGFFIDRLSSIEYGYNKKFTDNI